MVASQQMMEEQLVLQADHQPRFLVVVEMLLIQMVTLNYQQQQVPQQRGLFLVLHSFPMPAH
jgi:hypothetical protein